MKYVGNYIDRIPDGFIDMLINEPGLDQWFYDPDRFKIKNQTIIEGLEKIKEAGYADLGTSFSQYQTDTTPECFRSYLDDISWWNFKDILPREFEHTYWWIVKYEAGEMQPMHIDPHTTYTQDCMRYTIMLTDYVDGHIFVVGDKVLTDYKAGDLFLWDDYTCLHGAVNMSYEPRITVQLTFFNS